MAEELVGQVAIVTGGGRGVGLGVVEALAEAGMSLAVIGRTEPDIESAARLARRHGVPAVPIPTDVTNWLDVERMAREVLGRFGRIDLLVNNAGRARAVGQPWETDPETWWADIEVNLRGTFHCARAVLPTMVAARRGRIVNLATLAAAEPYPYASAYASSKAAVLRLTDSLAAATAAYGVSVFAISPGLVRTGLLDDLANSVEGRRWLPEIQTREDYWQPAAAGALIASLGSGVADRLTGRFIHVSDDLDDLINRADDIIDNDRLVLRMIR